MIFIGIATPLFLGGVVTGYVVLPKAIAVLLGFTQSGVANLQDINAFLSFMLRLMLVFGIAFLIPLFVLMLNIVGVVKASQLSKYRTLVIFGTFVFGAVATPSTDPFSMLALAVPMTLLFLVAEAIAHVLDRRKARRAAELPATIVLHSAGSSTKTNGLAPELSQRQSDDIGASTRTGRDRQHHGWWSTPRPGRAVPSSCCPQVAGTLRDGGAELEILLSRDFDEARAMAGRRSATASTCSR